MERPHFLLPGLYYAFGTSLLMARSEAFRLLIPVLSSTPFLDRQHLHAGRIPTGSTLQVVQSKMHYMLV